MTKANNGSGNTIERDDWETPRWLFSELNAQYGFGFDCCATQENKKCGNYSNDFLGCPHDCIKWMNPPFSKAKEMIEKFFQFVDKGVMIYRCDNLETEVWQGIIFPKADWIFIPNKRINYEHKQRKMKGSRFPSALIGIGVEPPKYLDGVTLFIRKKTEVLNE